MGERQHVPALMGRPRATGPGSEVQLAESLWSLSVDPDRALADWLRTLGGRVSSRVLLSSSTFQYFVAAAPGARGRWLSMVEGAGADDGHDGRGRRRQGYDLVILDAPATGHALALLSSPRTFAALARVGPIAAQTRLVSELLEDPSRSGYLAVAQGSEMAVAETLQLQERLRADLGRELDAVIVNAALPRRFAERELQSIAALEGEHAGTRAATAATHAVSAATAATHAVSAATAATHAVSAATAAAHAVHTRARAQNNQIARLRRRHARVLRVPFVFTRGLDLEALRRIADRLERDLAE